MRYSRKRTKRHQPVKIKYRINQQIRVPEVRVINEDGSPVGVMSTQEAIDLATEQEKTLVEVSPKANPPVAKILDYQKLQYQKQREASKQRAQQKKSDTKGIKLSVRIGKHDIEFRKNQAVKFLNDGNKVKIELNLRGRERQHKNLAIATIKDFIEKIKPEVEEEIILEQPIKYKGNGFLTIISKK